MFQGLNYKLQRRLSDVLPNQTRQTFVQWCTCACCSTLSGFPLQYCLPIALAFGRGAVARLSENNQTPSLTVKLLGRVDSYDVSPFDNKFGLTSYRKYLPGPLA